MKRLFTLLLGAIAVTTGCTKHGVSPDQEVIIDFGQGCISRIYTNTKTYINTDKQKRIDSLFTANNTVQPSYIVATSLTEDYVTTPGTLMPHLIGVRFLQYANRVQLFGKDLAYVFNNGVQSYLGGKLYGGKLDLDTIPKTDLATLRNIFLTNASKDSFNKQTAYKDSCLTAEFGYYDVSSGDGTQAAKFVKAWKVNTKSGYPIAYIQDDKKLIYYFNGIFTVQ